MEEKITLTVSYENHTDVVLTNSNGDTYTSKSEELMDFLLSSENKNVNVKPTITDKQIQEQAEKFVKEELEIIDKTLHQHDSIVSFIEGAKWMQEQDRWISVEDMLPDNLSTVICYLENGYIFALTYGESSGFFKPLTNSYAKKNRVTHWQPLPQPPKQD